MKRILLATCLIIFLISAIGMVCAEDANVEIISEDESGSVDLSQPNAGNGEGNSEVLGADLKAPDVDIKGPKGPEVDIKGPKAPENYIYGESQVKEQHVEQQQQAGEFSNFQSKWKSSESNSNFYTIDGVLSQQQQQQQQQQWISSLVIEKFWENNDSGSITFVEIEVYRIIKVQEQHVEQQQQAGEHDILAEPMFINIDGVEQQVEFVGRYNITKDNNWKLALNNLFFYSYYDYDAHDLKTDFFTYFVKEVNLPDNVFPVYSNYSRHVDNSTGLFVYWNLTNSIIPDEPVLGDEPPEEEVNETPEENEPETPAVDNPENPEVEDNSTDEITVEENKTSPTVEQSAPAAGEKKVLDVENATGNPLVLLLMVIAVLGIVVRRRD